MLTFEVFIAAQIYGYHVCLVYPCVFLESGTFITVDLTSHHTIQSYLTVHSYHVISIYIFKQLCSLTHTRAWLESHCDFLNHRLLAVFCPAFPVPLSALHPCFHLFAGFSLWIISVTHWILCRETTWSLRGDVLWHTFPNHQSVCHSTSTSISSRLETTNVYCRHNRLQSPLQQDYTQMSCQNCD